MMFNMYNYDKSKMIITGIIYLIIGVLLIVIPTNVLVDIAFSILGLFLIGSSIIPCIEAFNSVSRGNNYRLFDAIVYTITIILGVLIMWWHHLVVTIICATVLIIFPCVRLIMNRTKLSLKKELPLIIIGIVLCFFSLDDVFNIILKVLGGINVIYGLSMIVLYIIDTRKNNNNDNDDNSNGKKRVVIEADFKDVC